MGELEYGEALQRRKKENAFRGMTIQNSTYYVETLIGKEAKVGTQEYQ